MAHQQIKITLAREGEWKALKRSEKIQFIYIIYYFY